MTNPRRVSSVVCMYVFRFICRIVRRRYGHGLWMDGWMMNGRREREGSTCDCLWRKEGIGRDSRRSAKESRQGHGFIIPASTDILLLCYSVILLLANIIKDPSTIAATADAESTQITTSPGYPDHWPPFGGCSRDTHQAETLAKKKPRLHSVCTSIISQAKQPVWPSPTTQPQGCGTLIARCLF